MHLRPFLHLFLVTAATAATLPGHGHGAGSSTPERPSNARAHARARVSPRSSPKPNTAPLVGDVRCRKEDDFPGHPAIGAMAQYRAAQKFCADGVTDASLDKSDDPGARNGRFARDARFRYRDDDDDDDGGGVNHDFSISWEAGCKISLPSQSLRFPLRQGGAVERAARVSEAPDAGV
ncbi:hypothetical protein LZ30DRAFT_785504 [Colletotrichum cereale]|nr:hypothetical protein LZ30DRAFT_785504 [Colletotrichum cereale]